MVGVKPFETNNFFAGGGGMFIQYHDIVKPVYLYAILKMLLSEQYHGLPIDQLKNFSSLSLTEWYINRRYQNPLQSIDYNHRLPADRCNEFLIQEILDKDPSIYQTAPLLNIQKMMNVYSSQHMNCPIFVYTRDYEQHVEQTPIPGIHATYLHGDLSKAVKRCDNNFTYILSDIELAKELAELLKGTCSHILISHEYRYNKTDSQYKYNLHELQQQNQFVRIGTHNSLSPIMLAKNIQELITGGLINASS